MIRTPILVVFIGLISAIQTLAVEQKTIDTSNEFGGKTIVTRFEPEDREFKLEKKAEYFDRNGQLRRVVGYRPVNAYNELKVERAIERYSSDGKLQSVEIVIREERAREIGYNKIVNHYSALKQVEKKEVYYTKSDFCDQIYSKSVEYFGINGDKLRSEYYLSPDESRRTGFHKLVAVYEKGKLIKQLLQDKLGNGY